MPPGPIVSEASWSDAPNVPSFINVTVFPVLPITAVFETMSSRLVGGRLIVPEMMLVALKKPMLNTRPLPTFRVPLPLSSKSDPVG